jgi:hypothetical protein
MEAEPEFADRQRRTLEGGPWWRDASAVTLLEVNVIFM